jgi:hypothetical protein
MVEPTEQLRGKEPTPEGIHLPEPDAFPHVVMGKLALIVVFTAAGALAFYFWGGVVGLFLGSAFLLLVVVPMVVSRLNRAAQTNRAIDIEDEHEIEAQEQLAAAHSSPSHLGHEPDDHDAVVAEPRFDPGSAGTRSPAPGPTASPRH